MSRIIILANLFALLIGSIIADSNCGHWTSYRDEKCFKVINTVTPFSGAAQVCQKEGATIGIIRSAEEQSLVVDNLKNQSIVDNVWIGIKKNGNSFQLLDGNALKYTLWANNRPLNQTDVDCVQITVDDQDKWWDVKCEKKNAILCEKGQSWSNSKIEYVVQQIRQHYSERINLIEAKLEKLMLNQASSFTIIESQRKELDQLRQNPVPIGFIYIQLSGQSESYTLWPQTVWNNISPNYSGLFFRAEGGGSAHFGQVQSEQARSLQIMFAFCNRGKENHCFWDSSIPTTITSNFLNSGYLTGDSNNQPNNHHDFGLNFKYTTDEIRPRNQAIRIWIRIK